MIKTHDDERFSTISGEGTKIDSVWRQMPERSNGWNLRIRYKKKDDDMFGETLDVKFDTTRFKEDVKALLDKVSAGEKHERRLCYAHGMTDIDIYADDTKGKKSFHIRWSPNDGVVVCVDLPIKALEELNQIING